MGVSNKYLLSWLQPDCILLTSIGLALVLVAAAVFSADAWGKFQKIIPGEGKFDLKSSWVSNTAVLGAVLTPALKDIGSPPGIAGLTLLFATLALVAILIYQAGVRLIKGPKYESMVWPYLLSALVAIWAALGQLFTITAVILLHKPGNPPAIGPLTECTALVFIVVLLLAAAAICVFAFQSMRSHLLSIEETTAAPANRLMIEQTARGEAWPLL